MKKAVLTLVIAAGLSSSFSFAESLNQSAQSELLLMIQQLQTEVRQLRGDIETQQYKLQKLEREQLERYRDMDRRLSALLLSQAESAPVPAPVDPTPVEPTETAPQVTPPPAEATPAPVQVSDADAYQNAFSLVRERRFDEALTAFESFISTYPQSDNLANAYYWIGEVKLAQQNLIPAKEAFSTVVDRFADHRKRPDALYKLGVVEDRLGNTSAREQHFSALLNQYPNTSAAGLARNYQNR